MEENVIDFDALKAEADHYSMLLHAGGCTYEEAKSHVKPYVDAVNKRAKEIAKKYNRRAPQTTVAAFLR